MNAIAHVRAAVPQPATGSSGAATLERVVVRHRLAGLTLNAKLPLAVRPTLACPA